MTHWHIFIVDQEKGESWDMTVKDAPSRADAVLGALERIEHPTYDEPVYVFPQYLH